MAFTGVNRANVAVTDTFDTWRIRTNEVNTTLNLAAAANTADTLVYRDNAGSANLNVLNANTTVVTHTGTTDSAISVVSAVAAHSGGSYASILTTGGIYGTLSSKFAADLTIGTDLTINGNTALGSSSADEVTFTSTLSGDILPTVTSGAATITAGAATGSDLGATANSFAHIYTVQETISATSGITTNVFSVTSAAGAGNTATFLNNGATTGTVLSVLSSSTDTGARSLAKITQSGDVTTSGDTTGLNLAMTSGRGIFINSDDANGAYAFEIDSEHATTNTAKIDSAATSGTMLELTASGVLTGKGINFTADSAATGTGIFMTMDGLTTGKMIDLTSTGTLAGAGRVIDITADSATSGYGIDISMDALTTGSALFINSSSTHSGNLVSFVSDGAATGPTLFIRNDATSSTVKALQIANTTADIFSVTVAGDATVANDLTIAGDFVVTGNLSVAGATSEINTTTTVVKDKTLVLGTQSAVTAGATYTLATPSVVTSASHGLNNDDIIFVVSNSGTGLASYSEELVKVSGKTTNTFDVVDLDGNNIASDSTGTISWVGPQTDALVDDAGIYVPGSTAVHKFKWDDTLNYWEANASLHINDTGQLLLPKGTDAQKPASSIVGTVPAATTGAMRYNSTNSKIEAVLTTTSYENMSSETFATAIAIALG